MDPKRKKPKEEETTADRRTIDFVPGLLMELRIFALTNKAKGHTVNSIVNAGTRKELDRLTKLNQPKKKK